jgi:peroxiredoxin
VAWSGSDAEFQAFIDRHGLTFTQLSDDAGAVYDRFAIPIQPAVVVVQPDGDVETLFGAVDETSIDQLVGDALA